MAKEKINAPAFDDIVFEDRNKEYGAYKLRKKYNRNCTYCIADRYNNIGNCYYYSIPKCKSS